MAYKSIEQEIGGYFKRERPIGDFTRTAINFAYGNLKGVATIPTTVRKIVNNQLLLQRENYEGKFSKLLGAATGFTAGLCADIYSIVYLAQQTPNKRALPLALLTVANIGSGIYEMIRLSKSKKENRNLRERLED